MYFVKAAAKIRKIPGFHKQGSNGFYKISGNTTLSVVAAKVHIFRDTTKQTNPETCNEAFRENYRKRAKTRSVVLKNAPWYKLFHQTLAGIINYNYLCIVFDKGHEIINMFNP